MAQIFWEQIRNLLPSGGEFLTGSLSVSGSFVSSGSFGVSGSFTVNGQSLEDFVDARALSASTDYNQLSNVPSNIFSGSFLAGPNITINQTGQTVEISGSAATSYNSLTDIPANIVSSSLQFVSLVQPFTGSFTGSFTGDASGLTGISITTSSITNFVDGIISSSAGQAYIDSSVDGNLLSFTRLNGGSDAVNLGDIVPSTPTGSFLYSGSYNPQSATLTLFSDSQNYAIDLSALAGGGSATEVLGGSGLSATNDFEAGTATVSAKTSAIYGSSIINDTIAIDTGSDYFKQGVLKSGLFRPTGSYYSATDSLKITGSFDFNITGSGNEFSIAKDGEEKFKLNQDGVILFVSQSSTPNAVAGGMYYDQTDAFYLGFQN